MNALPLRTKLILAWLGLVSLAPALIYGGEAVGMFAAGRLPAAIFGSALSSLGGLLLFAPPRSSSPRAWLGQLRAGFTPPSSSTHSEP